MYLNEFLLVALVHLLAVMSPGPDFAVVIRNSVGAGRQAGLTTALGVGCGILVHVAYSLLGIGLIVSQSTWLFNLLKLAAAGYLFYLGVKALRSRPQPLNSDVPAASTLSSRKAFANGFITNGLNPKATLFFLGHPGVLRPLSGTGNRRLVLPGSAVVQPRSGTPRLW